MKIPDKTVELLRNQAPYAGTDLASTPVLSFLEELTARLTELYENVARVVLSPPATTVIAHPGTLQLSARLAGRPWAAQTLTWASSAPTIATVDSTGLVTSVAPGVVVITATSTSAPAVAGDIRLTVV